MKCTSYSTHTPLNVNTGTQAGLSQFTASRLIYQQYPDTTARAEQRRTPAAAPALLDAGSSHSQLQETPLLTKPFASSEFAKRAL